MKRGGQRTFSCWMVKEDSSRLSECVSEEVTKTLMSGIARARLLKDCLGLLETSSSPRRSLIRQDDIVVGDLRSEAYLIILI